MAGEWLLVVGAYALGTFPTAAVVARRRGHDPTREGSGNPGASNVYRTAGRRAGALVLVGDVLKGVAATGAGLAVGPRGLGVAYGLAAVVGHVLPLTRLGRGGKGVATAAGMAAVLHPVPSAVLGLVWLVLARVSGTASVASLAIAVGLPVAAAVGGARWPEVVALAACAALIVWRHRANIARLIGGHERSLRTG
jgi:glycerol-3-phosphate acyltransferase PlsY